MTKDDLKAWRERMRMSKVEVAKLFDVHPATVGRWEDGSVAIPGTVPLAAAAISNGWPPETKIAVRRRKWASSM